MSLQSWLECPPTRLQCQWVSKRHHDGTLWRQRQGAVSALMYTSNYLCKEAYRLGLIRTLPWIGQWALILPGSLYRRTTQNETWRVQIQQQVSYCLLTCHFRIQCSAFWEYMMCHTVLGRLTASPRLHFLLEFKLIKLEMGRKTFQKIPISFLKLWVVHILKTGGLGMEKNEGVEQWGTRGKDN